MMSNNPNSKTITWIAGGTIGLLAGLLSAYLIIKNREENGGKLSLTSKDGLKIGMGLATFLRQISDIGKII